MTAKIKFLSTVTSQENGELSIVDLKCRLADYSANSLNSGEKSGSWKIIPLLQWIYQSCSAQLCPAMFWLDITDERLKQIFIGAKIFR